MRIIKKSIQIVSQQGIKSPDTMAILVWVNTYISGYVTEMITILFSAFCAMTPSLSKV